MVNKYENKEICQSCKGACCKKSGCDYFVCDFPKLTKESLKNILDEGNVSIVAALDFKNDSQGKVFCSPFLYLRARNVDRGIIDLFSMKKTCSMLSEKGCKYPYEQRPSGGKHLIPRVDLKTGKYSCYSNVDRVSELMKWSCYQSLLSKMVKYYTGKTVNEKLKGDVENVFLKLITKDVDGIAKEELYDILSCLKTLIMCFPNEYMSAENKANNEKKDVKVLNRKKLF